jgi:hypothetical protein
MKLHEIFNNNLMENNRVLSQHDAHELEGIMVDEVGMEDIDDEEILANIIAAVKSGHNANLKRLSDDDIRFHFDRYIEENSSDWE